MRPFQRMGQQLLTDELIERLVKDVLEGEEVISHRTRRIGERSAVPCQANLVLLRVGATDPIGLGVLPLDEDELDHPVLRAVQKRSIDAGAVRAPDAYPLCRLREEV